MSGNLRNNIQWWSYVSSSGSFVVDPPRPYLIWLWYWTHLYTSWYETCSFHEHYLWLAETYNANTSAVAYAESHFLEQQAFYSHLIWFLGTLTCFFFSTWFTPPLLILPRFHPEVILIPPCSTPPNSWERKMSFGRGVPLITKILR